MSEQILFPVGRMIGGNLYKMFEQKDNAGQVKRGSDGQPVLRCSLGVAIKKGPEPHWNQTPWGQKIWQVGVSGFPNGEYNRQDFAWKIIDGDSNIPNKKGNKPCDQVGYPGHWVLWFGQSWLPKLVNAYGTQTLTEENAIVPGYFIQVFGEVVDNKPSQSPGVYLNPVAVALAGFGEKIITEVDTSAVGFGQGPLPAGASTVPPAGLNGHSTAVSGVPPATTTPAPTGAPSGIVPAPDFLNGPPAAPTGPIYTMTPAAQGFTREQYLAKGWTDDALIAKGLMTRDVPF